jgi:hypothetical protein
MAGYNVYCPHEGEAVHRMYQYPWVVSGLDRDYRPGVDDPKWEPLASFATKELADEWLTRNRANYERGKNGHVGFKVENWNE